MAKLQIIKGNIVKQHVDAIVNAANPELAGGGGVDGVIHRAAGKNQLDKACRKLNGCNVGQAKVTPAFNLPDKYIIHTVGPAWHNGYQHENYLLSKCYLSCLDQAVLYHCKSIAFCSISTGIYHFPLKEAAQIAVNTILSYKASIHVKMICYYKYIYNIYFDTKKKELLKLNK